MERKMILKSCFSLCISSGHKDELCITDPSIVDGWKIVHLSSKV